MIDDSKLDVLTNWVTTIIKGVYKHSRVCLIVSVLMIHLNVECILFDRSNKEMNGISVYTLFQYLLASKCTFK